MHLLNRYCQYKAYKNDMSNFIFKKMLSDKFTQAHAAFGRGIAISSDGYFCSLFRIYIALGICLQSEPQHFERLTLFCV